MRALKAYRLAGIALLALALGVWLWGGWFAERATPALDSRPPAIRPAATRPSTAAPAPTPTPTSTSPSTNNPLAAADTPAARWQRASYQDLCRAFPLREPVYALLVAEQYEPAFERIIADAQAGDLAALGFIDSYRGLCEQALHSAPFELDDSTRQYLLAGEPPELKDAINRQLDYERDVEQRRRVACVSILSQTQAIASNLPRYLHAVGEPSTLSPAEHRQLSRLWLTRDRQRSRYHAEQAGAEPADAESLLADAHCALMGCTGIAVSAEQALRYLRAAARAGHHGAMQQLSFLLETGQHGIAVDLTEALAWTLRRQAHNEREQGSAYYLGLRQLREQRERLELGMDESMRQRAATLARQFAEQTPPSPLPAPCRALALEQPVE